MEKSWSASLLKDVKAAESPTPVLIVDTQGLVKATNRGGIYNRTRWLWPLVAFCTCYIWYSLIFNSSRGIYTVSDENRRIANAFAQKGLSLEGKRAEEFFLSIPDERTAIAASRQYAGEPHMAGTEGDLATAKAFLGLLQRELGMEESGEDNIPIFPAGSVQSRNSTLSIPLLEQPAAWIDVYYPILNTPLDRSLEILGENGESVWSAYLEEFTDGTDADAAKYAEAVPTFHGISKDGEAQGKLVYAHYGKKEDYDVLVEAGIDLTGAIVITRYGGIFRGLKVKRAQELGAAAVLIYSDPRDDGTVITENGYLPYPYGPARNPSSVQRGSVQFNSLYAGDPSTPGYPAYEDSPRVDGGSKPTIPSLPISWTNAQILLKEIEEGGKNRTIKLVNHVDEKVTPIWNTMGVIPGHIKNEVVILGNHRDAWVLGASDPTSGTASVHEAVRGLGGLLRKGWKPLRTIVIASWDGEEYGLVGSTEWGEDFAEWINEHVVAYVNIDSSSPGSRLQASASPLLAHLVRDTAQQIPHPTSNDRTLWDARSDQGVLYGDHVNYEIVAMYEDELRAADSIGVSPLGSGSDYTVFLQYIGVPSADAGFSSTLHDPVYHYHSVFDSQRWQEIYGDPGFLRHVAIAKHIGLQILRLSNSIILPLNTTHYSYELEAYLNKVEAIASRQVPKVNLTPLRDSIHSLQDASLALDVEKNKAERELKKILKDMRKQGGVHHHITKAMRKLVCRIQKIFGKVDDCHSKRTDRFGEFSSYDESAHSCMRRSRKTDAPEHPSPELFKAVQRVQAVNKKLIVFERGFISKEGIKEREWYKHLGVAPGKWLGYGATTFPGLTEALSLDHNSTAAAYEAMRLQDLIDKLTQHMQL